MAQRIFDRRVPIASLMAIVLMGLAWGSLLRHGAAADEERIRAPELSEREFERFSKARDRPPRDAYSLTAAALAAVAIFFLGYETLRLVLQAGLVRLVGRHGRSVPEAGSRSSGGPRSTRGEAIGKFVFVVGVSLLWASFQAGGADEREAPAREGCRVEVEAPPEAAEPTERPNLLLSGVVFCAALLGAYELAGVTAAALAALATGGTVSRGAHFLLCSLGFVVFAAAGCISLYLALVRLAGDWLDEAPGWLMLPIMLVGMSIAAYAVERFLEAVPVPCSECGARAYLTSIKPTVYRCRECRHSM